MTTIINILKAINSNKIFFLILFMLLLITAPVLAQGDDFDNPGATDAPLDGGLSLLVAAGIAYGSKRAYDKRKKEKETMNDK